MYELSSDRFDRRPGCDEFAIPYDVAADDPPASLQNTIFSDLSLEQNEADQTFIHCSFYNVRWTCRELVGATFQRCHFEGTTFDGMRLIEVVFEECSAVSTEETTGLSCIGTIFRESRFDQCRLSEATFKNADVSQLRIEESLVTGCNFSGAQFARRVADVSINGFALVSSIARHLSFRRAALAHADFYGTHFADCDMSSADLEGAIFARGSLREVRLEDALLGSVDFRGTEFEKTNLSAARDWKNARVDEDRLDGLLKALGFRG